MQFHRKNGFLFLRFENLSRFPEVIHGIFTRLGGESRGPLASLNIGNNIGDSPLVVDGNRRAIAGVLDSGDLFFLSQVHGTDIVLAGNAKRPGEVPDPPESDGAISCIPVKMLVIQVADCQSVMLHDPVTKTVANIHSGWRGSVGNIIGKCVDAMQFHFGADPADMVAGIGPSLGPCCAEFIHYETEIPKIFWKYRDSENRFDFWQASRDQLQGRGILPESIESSNICTRCNPHLFFSYRHEKMTGRFASVIGLSQK